jgi:hypothetical protein
MSQQDEYYAEDRFTGLQTTGRVYTGPFLGIGFASILGCFVMSSVTKVLSSALEASWTTFHNVITLQWLYAVLFSACCPFSMRSTQPACSQLNQPHHENGHALLLFSCCCCCCYCCCCREAQIFLSGGYSGESVLRYQQQQEQQQQHQFHKHLQQQRMCLAAAAAAAAAGGAKAKAAPTAAAAAPVNSHFDFPANFTACWALHIDVPAQICSTPDAPRLHCRKPHWLIGVAGGALTLLPSVSCIVLCSS